MFLFQLKTFKLNIRGFSCNQEDCSQQVLYFLCKRFYLKYWLILCVSGKNMERVRQMISSETREESLLFPKFHVIATSLWFWMYNSIMLKLLLNEHLLKFCSELKFLFRHKFLICLSWIRSKSSKKKFLQNRALTRIYVIHRWSLWLEQILRSDYKFWILT